MPMQDVMSVQTVTIVPVQTVVQVQSVPVLDVMLVQVHVFVLLQYVTLVPVQGVVSVQAVMLGQDVMPGSIASARHSHYIL